jgi:geranylgeranyl reductase family protein
MTSGTRKKIYDVAVVGGGPAGSATAYYTAKAGLKTILFEKQSYPRPKPCGGGLSERSIPLLGKHAVNAINCKIEELRLFAPSYQCFTHESLPGYFVLRETFDHAMIKDAQEAGTTIMDNCRVKAVNQHSSGDYEIETQDGTITAKYVILATGFPKKALKKSPLPPRKFEDDYLAMTVMSETPIDNKILEEVNFSNKITAIFFGAVPNGYGWYFVKEGYVNIGIGATALLLKDGGALNKYHRFVKNLKEKGLLPKDLELAKERAFPLPFKKTAENTVFDNVLLVGDSAGFVSPVTGEGLYYAIKGGQLAAEAIHQNLENGTPLMSYQENWKKDFGNNLNNGYFLREAVYKSKRRMEFAVTLGRHDRKMSEILNKMISGMYTYREVMIKALLRLPITLFKMILPISD